MQFHHMVANLVSVSTRAHHDIQTALAFLTTWVKSPDEDNCGKLKRVIKYLNNEKSQADTFSRQPRHNLMVHQCIICNT